jgi:hypothetical protein
MCLLWSTNWVFISQETTFFIVTAVKPSRLTWHQLFKLACPQLFLNWPCGKVCSWQIKSMDRSIESAETVLCMWLTATSDITDWLSFAWLSYFSLWCPWPGRDALFNPDCAAGWPNVLLDTSSSSIDTLVVIIKSINKLGNAYMK